MTRGLSPCAPLGTYPAQKKYRFLKRSSIFEEQPFSAAFLSSFSSLSQQLFSAAILSYHLAVVRGWWSAMNTFFERTLSQRFREEPPGSEISSKMGSSASFYWGTFFRVQNLIFVSPTQDSKANDKASKKVEFICLLMAKSMNPS